MTFRKIKDPDAVLDYSIDWSAWLGSDEIQSSDWIITGPDSDLVADSDSKSTTAATVWLSGGTLYRRYTVTNRVVTTGGRTDDRSIVVDIESK